MPMVKPAFDIVNHGDANGAVDVSVAAWIARTQGDAVAQFVARDIGEAKSLFGLVWYDPAAKAAAPEAALLDHRMANDIVVSRGTGAGMAELRVEVDGHFMYNQRSDGLIVATPTGSTAYALSAGGPILQPELRGIVLVPIAPHALSNRPIALSDSCEIVIELASGRDCSVNFDMQSLTSLQQRDRIVVRRSVHTVTFLHPQGWSYYDTLREKLHWNEYPSALGQLK